MTSVIPFALHLDFLSGSLQPYTSRAERRASDLRGAFADGAALEQLVARGDPVIYQVLQYDVPEEAGQLVCCTTVLQPGTVGNEYFMTKGHYHQVRATGEVYVGLAGAGYLLLMTEEGEDTYSPITSGTVAYVPPGWAHRTVNLGDQPLVFLAIYPGNAGHDYRAIEHEGFRQRVMRTSRGPVVA
jgi:glucose-6-phosphate isomerase, archaeal